ncbi:MAG: ADP-ribosylglycohydrolase family protein [Chloroflexota bacterium]|nr:ADP-ribosylglycohydrolase family protein [Chloroflexota bacterium]
MSEAAPTLAERLAGAVWGHLVGDALGVPYEFKAPEQIDVVDMTDRGLHGVPRGTWSDDGALMLALLDSLLSAGFDPDDQGRRALAWATRQAYTPDGEGPFDIGRTTQEALRRIAGGTPALDAGGTGERDNGNGSLMRVLPVALQDASADARTLMARAHEASRVTHAHPRAQVVCALYVLVARKLLLGAERAAVLPDGSAELRAEYRHDRDVTRLAELDALEAWQRRTGAGYVLDSFWSAWDAFAGADSYRSAVVTAVKYGHDTDTTACIAGGLAGVYWGVSAIPGAWRSAMRGRQIVEPLVERLVASWPANALTP